MAFRMNRPFIIGIAGRSGCGKTLFVNCLLSHFTKNEISLISQDDYYKPKEFQPLDENGWINFDLPDCIDHEQLLLDLKNLLSGKTVSKREYTFNVNEENARTLTIHSAPIILIEGLFIFHYPAISKMLDMKIFIDTDEDISLSRRLNRDIELRGYSHEMIMYQWVNHVSPAYNTYLHPYKNSANKLIVNNQQVTDDLIIASQELSKELKTQLLNNV